MPTSKIACEKHQSTSDLDLNSLRRDTESTSIGSNHNEFPGDLVNGPASGRNAIRMRGLAGLVTAERITLSIRVEERAIDREGRLHAFGSCCNDELHATTGISRGINAGDVGGGVFAALKISS